MKELLNYNFVSFWKRIRILWAVHFVLILAGYCAGFFLKPEFSEMYSGLLYGASFIFPLCVLIVGPGSVSSYFSNAGYGVMWMSPKKPSTIITASFVVGMVYYACLFILVKLFLITACCIGSWGTGNMYAVNIFSGGKIPVTYRFLWAGSSFGERFVLMLKANLETFGKTLLVFFIGTGVGICESIFQILSCGYNKKKYGVFKINFIFSWVLSILGLLVVFLSVFPLKNVPLAGLVTIGVFSFILILALYFRLASSFIEKFHTL